jgi:hypothetical protein
VSGSDKHVSLLQNETNFTAGRSFKAEALEVVQKPVGPKYAKPWTNFS